MCAKFYDKNSGEVLRDNPVPMGPAGDAPKKEVSFRSVYPQMPIAPGVTLDIQVCLYQISFFNFTNLCHLLFDDFYNENFKFIVGSRGEGDSYHFLIQKRTRNSLFAATRLSDDIEDYLEKSGGPKSPGLLKRIRFYIYRLKINSCVNRIHTTELDKR